MVKAVDKAVDKAVGKAVDKPVDKALREPVKARSAGAATATGGGRSPTSCRATARRAHHARRAMTTSAIACRRRRGTIRMHVGEAQSSPSGDDIGNRAPRESHRTRAAGNEAPRTERPADADDNFGNR
jgi:hypothetical protein